MPKERQRISKGNSTNGNFGLMVSFCIEHAPFSIRLFKFVSNPSGLDLKDHHQSAANVLFDVVVCRVMRYVAVKQLFARKPGTVTPTITRIKIKYFVFINLHLLF